MCLKRFSFFSKGSHINPTKMKPQTNISVDVAKKRNDARDGREKGAHFILENKHVGLENEAITQNEN